MLEKFTNLNNRLWRETTQPIEIERSSNINNNETIYN